MEAQKIVYKETAIVALGELICCAVMVGVFAALGYFRMNVLWGALAGALIMTANYFFMAVIVSLAADKAQQEQVAQAKRMVKLSSVVRLILMAVLLFACIRLGANVIALVLPLVFVRPILMVAEFFRKKGD